MSGHSSAHNSPSFYDKLVYIRSKVLFLWPFDLHTSFKVGLDAFFAPTAKEYSRLSEGKYRFISFPFFVRPIQDGKRDILSERDARSTEKKKRPNPNLNLNEDFGAERKELGNE